MEDAYTWRKDRERSYLAENIEHVFDELIKEAEDNPDWNAVNALRCAKKELIKNYVIKSDL